MSKIEKAIVDVPEDHETLCFGFSNLSLDATTEEMVASFMEKFQAPDEALLQYRPVFLVEQTIGKGSSEVAESVGIFLKDNLLYEVIGQESYDEDFNGQWEPELVSPQSLRWRIENGQLFVDAYDEYTAPLQIQEELLECLAQWCPAMAPEAGRKNRP